MVLQRLFDKFISGVADTDKIQAMARVNALRSAYPEESRATIAERLIKRKCIQAGAVGAATTAASVIPGIGTVTSITLGIAADRAVTAKLHGELFLELLILHEKNMLPDDEKRALLLVTGVGAGLGQTLDAVGSRVAQLANQGLARRVVSRAIPVLSVASSAGMNVALTYLVGRRTLALCGEQDLENMSWADTARMLTGVDERKLANWARESAIHAWALLAERLETLGGRAVSIVRRAGDLVVKAMRTARSRVDQLTVAERANAAKAAKPAKPAKAEKPAARKAKSVFIEPKPGRQAPAAKPSSAKPTAAKPTAVKPASKASAAKAKPKSSAKAAKTRP